MAQAKYIGGGSGALDLDSEVFGEGFHGPVVHEAVRAELVKVNRKAHRRALRAALSLHAERDSIAAIDPSGFVPPSTRTAAAALADWEGDGTVLVVLSDGEEACARSFRNIAGVSVVRVDRVGVVDIVGAGRLVVSGTALERLTEKAVAK
jgi:large subunit ribosomal protein L4